MSVRAWEEGVFLCFVSKAVWNGEVRWISLCFKEAVVSLCHLFWKRATHIHMSFSGVCCQQQQFLLIGELQGEDS